MLRKVAATASGLGQSVAARRRGRRIVADVREWAVAVVIMVLTMVGRATTAADQSDSPEAAPAAHRDWHPPGT
jgi:hypothetical protein